MDLQHDPDEVAARPSGQNGVRDQAARIGHVLLHGEAGPQEMLPDKVLQPGGRKPFLRPDAQVGRDFSPALRGKDLIRIAVQVKEEDPGMPFADPVQPGVVRPVIPEGLFPQLLRDRLDHPPVICFFIAEAHAVSFHRLLRPREALRVAEQPADREDAGRAVMGIRIRDHRPHVRIAHFFMVRPELLPWNTDRGDQLRRELPPVMRDVEDRETGRGNKAAVGDILFHTAPFLSCRKSAQNRKKSVPSFRRDCLFLFFFIPSVKLWHLTVPGRLSCGHRACPSRTLHRRYSVDRNIIQGMGKDVKEGGELRASVR